MGVCPRPSSEGSHGAYFRLTRQGGRAGRSSSMRGIVTRLVLPFVALAALAAVGTAGGASKAAPTFVFAGAADPTYLDPALVSDGESFRVTGQIFERLVSHKPGSTRAQAGLATE